jgi:predicted SprT family Zn-dependent metalloprotease
MKPTIKYVQDKFREYNQLFFKGTLQEIPIELSDAKGFIGVCRYKKRELEDGTVELYDFRLRINARIDLPEEEIQDTIIHEMIHYFIGVNRLEDSSSHGPMFQHLMNTINQQYCRHITISHKGTKEEAEQAIDKRAKWHVIAVVTFFGGRRGIKVLPRIIQRILDYRKGMLSAQGVDHLEFYMSNDPFFNRFPNSAALNIYDVPTEDIDTHLVGAKRIVVTVESVVIHEYTNS